MKTEIEKKSFCKIEHFIQWKLIMFHQLALILECMDYQYHFIIQQYSN